MATMNLTKEGAVFVLTMTNGAEQNTMTLDWTAEFQAALDEVAAAEGNAALLVTSNDPKFWSNGINLPWLLAQPKDCFPKLAKQLDDLFVRIALLDMPTVACCSHCAAETLLLAKLVRRILEATSTPSRNKRLFTL